MVTPRSGTPTRRRLLWGREGPDEPKGSRTDSGSLGSVTETKVSGGHESSTSHSRTTYTGLIFRSSCSSRWRRGNTPGSPPSFSSGSVSRRCVGLFTRTEGSLGKYSVSFPSLSSRGPEESVSGTSSRGKSPNSSVPELRRGCLSTDRRWTSLRVPDRNRVPGSFLGRRHDGIGTSVTTGSPPTLVRRVHGPRESRSRGTQEYWDLPQNRGGKMSSSLSSCLSTSLVGFSVSSPMLVHRGLGYVSGRNETTSLRRPSSIEVTRVWHERLCDRTRVTLTPP